MKISLHITISGAICYCLYLFYRSKIPGIKSNFVFLNASKLSFAHLYKKAAILEIVLPFFLTQIV